MKKFIIELFVGVLFAGVCIVGVCFIKGDLEFKENKKLKVDLKQIEQSLKIQDEEKIIVDEKEDEKLLQNEIQDNQEINYEEIPQAKETKTNIQTIRENLNVNSNQDNSASANTINNSSNKQEVTIPTPSSPQQNQVVEKKIWEEYGMTEDEYYNKPINKKLSLDFSVAEYGTESDAFSVCETTGRENKPKNGGFGCTPLNSQSGRVVGYHIDYFETHE